MNKHLFLFHHKGVYYSGWVSPFRGFKFKYQLGEFWFYRLHLGWLHFEITVLPF
jgi:hypothetical protein